MRPCHGYERTPALEQVEFTALAWGCQSQKPGCLIDRVGADSLPAEPHLPQLSCSSDARSP